jgi:hypothetical protein
MLLEIEVGEESQKVIDFINENGIGVEYLDDEEEDIVLCNLINEVTSEENIDLDEFVDYLRS